MSRTRRNILLVEPDYKNKFPPLGLMKIATYHRLLGDHVVFVKGESPEHKEKIWHRIYITTLFTYFWKKTIKTIYYYSKSTHDTRNVYIGGILATLMQKDLLDEFLNNYDFTYIYGLLDEPNMLDHDNKYIVERMVPNYAILDEIDYQYHVKDSYIGYATRGCTKNCRFCAVRILEPYPRYKCEMHTSVIDLVRNIDQLYGQKRDLLLMDNNILASSDFEKIINEIILSGFEKGATHNRKKRRLDFNQGLDARLMNQKKAKLLAKTAIMPIRFACDNSRMMKSYEKAVRIACNYGLTKQSTYVLFNYKDTPEDFYQRLHFNLKLNEEMSAKISSFPMKYIPLNSKDRKYIGKHWHRKIIRGVQCILLATKGMVSPNPDFFRRAFGENEKRFREICMMPENYIIWRDKNEQKASEWCKLYRSLSRNELDQLMEVLAKGKIKEKDCMQSTGKLKKLMGHYI